MRIFFIFFSILCFQLFFGCPVKSQWKGVKEKNDGIIYVRNPEKGLWGGKKRVNMELVLTIGVLEGDDDYILANPSSVITDRNCNIYICDIMDDCVKVFDEQGVFKMKIGRKGQGPGEFFNPKKMIITNDGLLCILSKTKISLFTLEGKFIDCSVIQDATKFIDLAQIPGNPNIFFTMDIQFKTDETYDNVIYEYSTDGKLVNKYGAPFLLGTTQLGEHYSRAYITVSQKGDLFCMFSYPYMIRVYDKNLDHKMTITRQFEIFNDKPKIKQYNQLIHRLKTRADAGKILMLPDNKFLVPITDWGLDTWESFKPDETFKIIYDLFDSEGYFLQSFNWKEDGQEFIDYIDQRGYAYTLSGSGKTPCVRKYKITFIDK